MADETTSEAADAALADSAEDAAPTSATPAAPESAPAPEASTGGSVVGGGEEGSDTAVATRPARKVREGMVVSNKMDKTAIVVARDRVRHRRYNKTVQRDKRLHVHDENNELNVGDRVRVEETRPLSKNKRWRLLEILEQAR